MKLRPTTVSDPGAQRNRLIAVLVACVLAVVVGALVVWMSLVDSDAGAPDTRSGTEARGDAPPAPTEPPVKICGNAEVLDGPRAPPERAVVVSTSQNLQDLTKEHPAGTTFWLTAGVHTVGTEPYSQVTPKEGNVYLGAPGATLDGQHLARYAFVGDAAGVAIGHLTIQNFGAPGDNNDAGVVNHDAAADWVIENNSISGNAGAAVMVGSGNIVRNNCLAQNGQYGINAYHPDGVADITIENNEITGNNVDDWEAAIPGCGCTGGAKFWEVTGAIIRANWVHDNQGVGLWVDTNNAGFAIEGNYISGNDAEGIIYETSYNASIRSNALVGNGHVKGPQNPGFPTAAIYVSESGSDARVRTAYRDTFEISHNVFVDNWAGVILWENADRFAGSPANTSSGSGTRVNPGTVTWETCNEANIGSEPYIDDCRWKTINVRVHNNDFLFDADSVGAACRLVTACGFNGIFSNWGTYPTWSPYQGEAVQEAITFRQGNQFFENTYTGPWHFVIYEQGTQVDWSSWQGAPYGQDAGSVIKLRTVGQR